MRIRDRGLHAQTQIGPPGRTQQANRLEPLCYIRGDPALDVNYH
jgi:hypothetical protein